MENLTTLSRFSSSFKYESNFETTKSSAPSKEATESSSKYLDSSKPYKMLLSRDQVDISSDSKKALAEEALLNDPKKTSMSMEKDDSGRIVYQFTNKKSGEVIKQIPSDSDLANIERINKYLQNIASAVMNGNDIGTGYDKNKDGIEDLMSDEELSKIVESFRTERDKSA